jgi:hypothetical protein
MTIPWFGAVVSIITESNVILPMDPALFSAYIDIMLGFPANKKKKYHKNINIKFKEL